MTSPFVRFFGNVNLFSSYDGLSSHQIWFDLDEGKQSYGGGPESAPHVENVLKRPGEIGLKGFYVPRRKIPRTTEHSDPHMFLLNLSEILIVSAV